MGVQVSPLAPKKLMKSIILIGFMGSGKTETGKKVAQKGNLLFFDSDEIIKKRFGNITDLFGKKGEKYFRTLEYSVIKEIFDNDKLFVLSVGGGAFCIKKTSELLLKNGTIFFLDCPFEICYKRIKQNNDRPLVGNGKDWLRELYKKRVQFYKNANFRIDASKSTDVAAKEILSKFENEAVNI
ncbi:MAG: shikimate kinase [bacterium]|nr:MAG: shikimate kinase [bacterium]